MFKKSLILTTMAAVLSCRILPVTQAFAAAKTIPVTSVAVNVTDGQVEASGKLGVLVRGALGVIKGAVKTGGDVLYNVVKWLDKDTAKYFANNSSKIMKGIDNAIAKIDTARDYATGTIRTIVLDGLRIAGVPDSYGVAIAEAIATTVDWLLL
ncbi:hypothetical protein M5X00_10805 [Paenibacillus alvei]|uniref:hypothetical protein n=1 Tax=Paenibacillus alvei TaxID=44250 RepID=UPI000288B6C9|nr:hypothetical protein [Paenibacillus alvei]EJW15104.1 hypothetical protein PAV_9c00260 [Paenibacillus alvei DSM 29]MCY9545252.1 hypothetical protein [Paenibacillus alvei]MCY9705969.1 hypothetical protein [Paenibacillus alvei]MCY9737717.1 hypothetical protein [Paenibacillus alvei]MCY9754741.1 hypothetical protein [Paenibacillus alvei]